MVLDQLDTHIFENNSYLTLYTRFLPDELHYPISVNGYLAFPSAQRVILSPLSLLHFTLNASANPFSSSLKYNQH